MTPNSKHFSNPAWDKPCLRIGHGGAAGLASANSLDAIRLALKLGVDVVEFDVRACRDALVLIHDDNLEHLSGRPGTVSGSSLSELRALAPDEAHAIATLPQALELIRGHALINLDVKGSGYEAGAVEAVRAHGMGDDVLYSSLEAESLVKIRQADPGAMTGFSYPEDKGNSSGKAYLQPVVNAVLAWMRFMLPFKVMGMMAASQADAVMLYHRVISRRTVKRVHQAGGKVFTWTVDTLPRMQALQQAGVDGIASNRPDLFTQLAN